MAALTILPWNEFQSFFKPENKQSYDILERMLVIGDDKQLQSNWPTVNTVKNMGDLERVREQFFTKLLVLHVKCAKHVPVGNMLNNRGKVLSPVDLEWWFLPSSAPPQNTVYHNSEFYASDPPSSQWLQVQFAVIVDTSHAVIARQMREGFKTAEMLLKQGKSFCIEFNFNPVIFKWWLEQGPKSWLRPDCLDTSYCINGRLAITNTTTPCHHLDFASWWLLCFPCYVMLSMPYKVWRTLLCQVWDHSVKMEGNIDVVTCFRDVKIQQLNQPNPKHLS